MGGWTNPSAMGGGTITGDVTITGDLTVQGTTTSVVNQTISGTVIVDLDNTEALLVRKDGDAGDVLVVDATNSLISLGGVTPVTGVTLLLPLSNDAVTPTLAFGDGGSGFYQSAADTIVFSSGGIGRFQFNSTFLRSINSAGPGLVNETASATNPTLLPDCSDADTGIGQAAANELSLITAGVEAINIDSSQLITVAGHVTSVATIGFNLRNEEATDTNPVYTFTGNLGTGMGLAATSQLSLITSGVEQMRLNVTGNHILNSLLDEATNEVALSLNYTVNKAGGDDTGLLVSLTDTASPGTSRILDLHLGGNTVFFVDRNGLVQFEQQVRGANANAPTILDEAASATNPTLIPNLANTTAGIGGATGEVSLITGGVEAVRIDANQDIGIGIAPVTGVQLLLPQENDAATPTLAFGAGGDTGFYESSANELSVAVGASRRWLFLADRILADNGAGPFLANETSSATNVTIGANRGELNTGLGGASGQLSVIITSDEAINISEASNIMETKFDAGDNAAGNVGAWTSILSAVATLTSVADTKLTAASLIPAGCHLLGVTGRITTGFGSSTGLTDFDVGDGTDLDRWGNSLAITAGTTFDLTDATAAASGDFASVNDVVLTANGGNFDTTGVIELIVHYITLTPPTG